MDAATLDHLFTYHPPTPETQPKYAAIAHGYKACLGIIRESLEGVAKSDDLQHHFNEITGACRGFADIINVMAPDSADKTAAIRCLRIARMAANETALVMGHARADIPDEEAEALFVQIRQLAVLCENELVKARWQANAAIACGGRS